MFGRRNNFYALQPIHPTSSQNGDGDPITSVTNGGGGGERPEPQPRVVRSEVWSRFRLEGLNAVCLVCNERLKVGPTRQTSSLWRHLKRHNRGPPGGPSSSSGFPVHSLRFQYQQSRYAQQPFVQQLRGFIRAAVAPPAPRTRTFTFVPTAPAPHQSQAPRAFAPPPGALRHLDHHPNHPPTSQLHPAALPSASSSQSRPFSQSSAPLVTVDCKPVESTELDQLLGISRGKDEEGGGEGMEVKEDDGGGEGIIRMEEEEMEEDDGGMMEDEEEDEEEEDEPGIEAQQWLFGCTLIQFLVENALPFHRVLVHSPTLDSLLHLACSSSSKPLLLPSPAFLLQRVLPKLFADILEQRLRPFRNDFFVLVMERIPMEQAEEGPEWVCLISISARHLSSSFDLRSRRLGLLAFRPSSRSSASTSLNLFDLLDSSSSSGRLSAIVHDGYADCARACRVLGHRVPAMPAALSLLGATLTELDRLQMPAECVRRVKSRFEEAMGEMLEQVSQSSGSFSVLALPLITRIDQFFRAECPEGESKRNEEEEAEGRITTQMLERQLVDNFRRMWHFQRRRLMAGKAARAALFVNPGNLFRKDEGEVEKEDRIGWEEVAEEVAQRMMEEEEEEEMDEEERDDMDEERRRKERKNKMKADIQAEVANYMETARTELGHPPAAHSLSNGDSSPLAASPSSASSSAFRSLADLLFWWRVNSARFPRLVRLARQLCALPLCIAAARDAKSAADYAARLLGPEGDLAAVESGEEERMALVSQLLTVRMDRMERLMGEEEAEEVPEEGTSTVKLQNGGGELPAEDAFHLYP